MFIERCGCVCVCVLMRTRTHAIVICMWVRGQLASDLQVVFFLHLVGFGDQAQMVKLIGKHLYSLN